MNFTANLDVINVLLSVAGFLIALAIKTTYARIKKIEDRMEADQKFRTDFLANYHANVIMRNDFREFSKEISASWQRIETQLATRLQELERVQRDFERELSNKADRD